MVKVIINISLMKKVWKETYKTAIRFQTRVRKAMFSVVCLSACTMMVGRFGLEIYSCM